MKKEDESLSKIPIKKKIPHILLAEDNHEMRKLLINVAS